jgi:hypothetical protein
VDPSLVTAILAGVNVIVATVGGLLVQRSRKAVESLPELRKELRVTRRLSLAALDQLYRCEIMMVQVGLKAPDRPPELIALEQEVNGGVRAG